jgi:hypothetical protein
MNILFILDERLYLLKQEVYTIIKKALIAHLGSDNYDDFIPFVIEDNNHSYKYLSVDVDYLDYDEKRALQTLCHNREFNLFTEEIRYLSIPEISEFIGHLCHDQASIGHLCHDQRSKNIFLNAKELDIHYIIQVNNKY